MATTARPDINADGYYNDRLPIDYYESKKQKIDPAMAKKLGAIIGGIVVFIGLCIFILTLM